MSIAEADRALAACGSAMAYRAEVARILHEAAARRIIPQRFHLGRAVTDLGNPAECCWLVDKLCRTDLGRRWAYVAALQPELGEVVGYLRAMRAAEERVARGLERLEALRQRAQQAGTAQPIEHV